VRWDESWPVSSRHHTASVEVSPWFVTVHRHVRRSACQFCRLEVSSSDRAQGFNRLYASATTTTTCNRRHSISASHAATIHNADSLSTGWILNPRFAAAAAAAVACFAGLMKRARCSWCCVDHFIHVELRVTHDRCGFLIMEEELGVWEATYKCAFWVIDLNAVVDSTVVVHQQYTRHTCL